jgi:hypothetical protein
MMLILKVALLVGLIRMLISTDKPLLCAGLYAVALTIVEFLFQVPIQTIAISVGISFAVAFIYFWLLNRFHSGLLYWAIFLLGMPIFLFV